MKAWLQTVLSFPRRLFADSQTSVPEPEAVVRQLDVEARARSQARQNLPSALATHPDEEEQRIERHHLALLRRQNDRYQEMLREHERQMAADELQWQAERFVDCSESVRVEHHTLQAQVREPIVEAAREVRAQYSELKAFKQAHRLEREAVHPDYLGLHYALLAATLLLEGVLNSFFFAQGSHTGWLGGFQEALCIAATNVGAAVGAGMLLRHLFHRSVLRRMLAGALLAGYAAALVAFHLAVGHYRTALVTGLPEQAVSQAIVTFTAAPWTIPNFQSWLLVLAGLAGAGIALLTEFKRKDRYPGYTEVVRRLESASRQLEALKTGYLAATEMLFAKQRDAVEQRCEAAVAAMRDYMGRLVTLKAIAGSYHTVAQAIVASHVHAIQRYRAVNRQVRLEAPPDYFAEPPRPFAQEVFLNPATEPQEAVAAGLKPWALTLRAQADAVKGELRAWYEETIDGAPAFFARLETLAAGSHPPGVAVQALGRESPAASEVRPRGALLTHSGT